MYVNKSEKELKTTAFYGDVLDLVNMGVDIEGIEFDDNWTVKKFLSITPFAKKRIENVFKYLDLDTKYLNVKIKDLSKVIYKYVLLSHAILNNKRVIIFERFDVGLSNKEKKNMVQIMKKLLNDGITIILITKDLIFANQVCENIIVIKNKKDAGLQITLDHKELLKDIFREVV